MRTDRLGTIRMRSWTGGQPLRAFTLTELLIVIAIIAIILAIAVPSFTTISKDLELKQARSEVFAALTAARSRAIRDHTMVALHIFRDTAPAYQQMNPLRWPTQPNHLASGKLTMRLEVPCINPQTFPSFNHVIPGSGIVEFTWLGDHDPIIVPESLGIARPQTNIQGYVDVSKEIPGYSGTPPIRLMFYEDFYIVFAEDGKPVTVLVDYNLNPSNNNANASSPFYANAPGVQTQVVYPGTPVTYGQTWSASGFCLYDMQTFKGKPDAATQTAYVNRPENTIIISPYSGLPLSSETSK